MEKCINSEIKEKNYPDFYFDMKSGFYRPCYEKCQTCSQKGDGNENNCLTCASGYILKPDYENTFNCVEKYKYLYYYNEYNQYTITETPNCPEKFPFKIKEKNKCIEKCVKDPTFKYAYNNHCFKECPNNTSLEEENHICKDDPNKCILTENEIYIFNISNINKEINELIPKYAKEYHYTENHVSIINLGNYSITLYKNKSCLSELSVSDVLLDLSSSILKVKKHYNMENNEELIVGLIKNSSLYENFEVYDPKTGEPLNIFDLCKNDTYGLQKSLIGELINNPRVNFNDLQDLANQEINVIDLTDPFYNDICFHYKSKFDKDVPLKDRVLIYYPNISLCDEGCELEAVYTKNWTAKCNCLFDIKNSKFKDSSLYQSQLGEIDELISLANINVMKCYKDIFQMEYFKKSYGNFIILSLIFINIICAIIYFFKSYFYIKKYIFILIGKYLSYLKTQNPSINIIGFDNSFKSINGDKLSSIEEKMNYSSPPPKFSGEEKINVMNDENKNNNNEKNTNKSNESSNDVDISNNDNIIIKNNVNVNNNDNNNFNIKDKEININRNININNNNFGGKIIKKSKKKKGMSMKSNLDVFNKNKNKKLENLDLMKNKLKNCDSSSNGKSNCIENSSSKYSLNNKTKININKRLSLVNLNKLNNSNWNLENKKNIENNLEMILKDNFDINIEEYLNTDPDEMDYDESLKRDDRKFCTYYLQKIKANQILINTFYFKESLRPLPIKIMLLDLQIDLYFFINGFFYNEEYIKNIFYLEEDTLYKAFLRFIDNLFYAFLVGVIINYIIDFFFIEEKKLRMTLKREKDNILVLKYEMIQIIKDINTRFITFISVTFVISVITWYHLYCFNNIYPHIQKEWLIFSILIILSVQILSLLASLAETIIRFLSFRFKSEKLFKLSQLLA